MIPFVVYDDTVAAGWRSLEARRAHNPEVAGSNPAPATTIASSEELRTLYFYHLEERQYEKR